jgi:hypothetical protein
VVCDGPFGLDLHAGIGGIDCLLAGRWQKDVKQVKLSVEGADVKITSVVLGWDNRKDATLTNLGTLKAGGQTAAPGRKGRLTSVKVQYEILGDKPTATVKILGYD